MDNRDTILAYIAELKDESETVRIYGDNWMNEEYRARRSQTAGQICLLVAKLERLKAKADRRPKSIGARKARRELIAGCHELKELEGIVSEPFECFHPSKLEYLTEPLNTITYQSKSRIKIEKKRLEARLPQSVT